MNRYHLVAITGIARGSTTVVVERVDGPVAIDLSTALASPLTIADGEIEPTTRGAYRLGATLTGADVLAAQAAAISASELMNG